jgi:malonyl-CoA/methylmalonyl-CoA synthetase
MNHLFDEIRARMPPPEARFLEAADRTLSYGDMLARSGRLAEVLVQLGIGPGDRVAVQVEKSPEAVLLYFACVRAGAVFLPLNPAYTPTELAYFFSDAEPRLIVCAPGREADIAGIAGGAKVETLGVSGGGTILSRAAAAPADFADAARGPGDLAAILYTSGTTGRSKGAMLTHENLASNARTLVEHWRFTRADVLLHALPIFHTHGLFVAINTVLFAGASMIFLSRFEPGQVLGALERATTMMGVPTFYVRLLEHPGLTREATAHVRLFVSGSAPLLAETFAAWCERTGHALLERYGMTETSMNTSNPYDGERRPGTVGMPLAGVELRIADPESGDPLPQGEIGMVEVRGPNVFKGYWRMPDKTASEFRGDGYFITGDLGRVDSRGYLQIVGRSKDIVISGGLNVYPKEVEAEIDQVPGVVESAVIGLPHPDFGEGVTAVVVRDTVTDLDETGVMAAIGDRLARFKQPKRILFLDELPRNTMGKVQKNLLRDRFQSLYTALPQALTRTKE